jgi:hypothetical protein
VAVTLKLKRLPAAVGVPERTPLALNTSPAGRLPVELKV